jgi:hypothetical protein
MLQRHHIDHMRRRARECRAAAEIEPDPARRQEWEETALAYERMAARAERYGAAN